MLGRLIETVRSNRRLIVITFEVFWILVFLLDCLGKGSVGSVSPFVYVNF